MHLQGVLKLHFTGNMPNRSKILMNVRLISAVSNHILKRMNKDGNKFTVALVPILQCEHSVTVFVTVANKNTKCRKIAFVHNKSNKHGSSFAMWIDDTEYMSNFP